MTRLSIEPIGLHWLYTKEPTDLCAHGGIRVSVDGQPVFETEASDNGYAVSAGALYLLRTLHADHLDTSEDFLFPHCAHEMFVEPDTGKLVNISSCPSGVDWQVRHLDGGEVELCFSNGFHTRVSDAVWRKSVADFSAAVRVFFFETPRLPSDDFGAEWFEAFCAEWNERHREAVN